MAYNIPTSGQYISFPVNILRAVEIKWQEDLIQHSNFYYVTKCFYGYLDSYDPPLPTVTAPSTDQLKTSQPVVKVPERAWPPVSCAPEVKSSGNIVVRGSTDLFVASEYFDEHYQNGPLSKYHLKDIASANQNAKWLTMQLNQCFHYGQDGDATTLQRFIVYHPIAPPRVFQHRFTNTAADALLTIVNGVSIATKEVPMAVIQEASSTLSTIVEFGSKIVENVKNYKGTFLHQFLDKDSLADAQARWEVQARLQMTKDWRANVLDNLTKVSSVLQKQDNKDSPDSLGNSMSNYQLKELSGADLYVLSVQLAETSMMKRDNDVFNKMLKARWDQQMARLENIMTEQIGYNRERARVEAKAKEDELTDKERKRAAQTKSSPSQETESKGVFSSIWGAFSGSDTSTDLEKIRAFNRARDEALRIATAPSTDNVIMVVTSVLAVANNVRTGTELGQDLIQRKTRIGRSSSNPDLRGTANLISDSMKSSGQRKASLQRNAGP